MSVSHTGIVPSKSLHLNVRAGFVAQGTSLGRWCRDHGVRRQNAEKALKGVLDRPWGAATLRPPGRSGGSPAGAPSRFGPRRGGLMREGWLSAREFAGIAAIDSRSSSRILSRAHEGHPWRGHRLEVRKVRGGRGRAGRSYEVRADSLPDALRDAASAAVPALAAPPPSGRPAGRGHRGVGCRADPLALRGDPAGARARTGLGGTRAGDNGGLASRAAATRPAASPACRRARSGAGSPPMKSTAWPGCDASRRPTGAGRGSA